ncbi:MAG: ABC transporter substrate-binding protein [Chloroflexota bacterium]
MSRQKALISAVTVLLILTLAVVSSCVSETTPTDQTTEKVYKIGETMIVEHPDLFSDRDGFREAMAEAGFVEGENVEYIFKNAQGDMSLAKTIADQFVSQGVDLMHPIATPTSQACVAAAEGTDIPVVFSTCTAPAEADIVSQWEAPRTDNVTGVSDMADIRVQMEMIREICPDFEVLGVIYNSGEVNSVQQINGLKGLKDEVGIEKVVEANVSTAADCSTAAKSLAGRVDVVWIPTDNTAVSGIEAIIKVCEDNDLPFFGSTSAMVGNGCIAARGANYSWIGHKAGEYAASILKGEKTTQEIPVVKCSGEAQKLVVNPGAAERMGIILSDDVMEKAAEVVE